MAFIEWRQDYSIGIPEADDDHRQLIELINELHEAIVRDSHSDTIGAAVDELETVLSVLDELLAYGAQHFQVEEDLMLRFAYPDYDKHKEAHAVLADTVQTYRRDFDDGEAVVSMEIVRFLKNWLDAHILDMDRKLGDFLQQQGAASTAGKPLDPTPAPSGPSP